MIETIVSGASAWVWDKYGKDITDKALGTLREAWQDIKWNEAAELYRHRMSDLYGTIRVLGSTKPVPLEGVFTDVFILDKPTAFQRFDIKGIKKDPSSLDKAKRMSGLRLITQSDSHRLFILGKPGAGKTTFLKYITILATNNKINKIPIFVSLKEWADSGLSLIPFIIQQFDICNFPDARTFIEKLLKKGDALVLFDGLDEINRVDSQRTRSITAINNFSKQYHTCQCLITCRIAATDYAFEKFTYVEIADFTERQIHTFVHKWFNDNPTKRDKFLEEFKSGKNRGLREIARIPLLLSLLCLAFDETMTFPQRRVEIYEEALDALLKKWDASRNIRRDEFYRGLSLGRKRHLFARIAAETFERGEYFFQQDELESQIVNYLKGLPTVEPNEFIDGEGVLKAIEAQHSIFIERAHRIYSFSHLTFQEYFTAKYIADNAASGTIERLVSSHLADNRWQEVFLLTASMLDDADKFIDVFRQGVDYLVDKEQAISELLKWVNIKTRTIDDDKLELSIVRSIYLSLALDLARTRAYARAYTVGLDRTRDRAYGLDTALTQIVTLCANLAPQVSLSPYFESEFNKTLALTRNRKAASSLVKISAQVLANARAMESKLPVKIQFDLDLTLLLKVMLALSITSGFDAVPQESYQSAYEEIVTYISYLELKSQQTKQIKLQQALENLRLPDQKDNDLVWRRFAIHLREIIIHHRNIGHQWNFNREQIAGLLRYLEANLLLIECLRLAYVSNRSDIENKLLLFPRT